MTPSQLNFLMILKDAVRPQKEAPSLIQPVDWQEILTLAVKQNILPLIYDNASRYPGFAEFEAEHGNYFNTVMSMVGNQTRRTAAFLELYRAFLAEGVQPVTVKGIVCRSLYGEKQDYRPSGDEDLLVEKHEFEKAAEVLAGCGYESEGAYSKNGMAYVQEVTFTNKATGLVIELHVNPFGTENHIRKRMDSWFKDVFTRTDTLNVEGIPIRTMNPTDNFLFTVFHAFKHFTNTGFGIRMMFDILLFMEGYYDSIDWEYIERALCDIKATRFFTDLIALGNKYLGFYLPQRARPTCPEELLSDMFTMGTFGNTNCVDAAADRFTNIAINRNNKGFRSRSGDMLRVLFPSWETWKRMKPFLADKPYLLPVEWVKRLARYQKQKNSGGVDLYASREVSKRRIELLEKYGVL